MIDTLNTDGNRLAIGDNLELLKLLPNESIDLIYLDPPFNSNKNYIVVDKHQVKYFKDVWKGDQYTYLEFMFDRLLLMKTKLKDTGSLYLHCDPSWSHYIKVMMDKVFGQHNFRNEIIWKRTADVGAFKKRNSSFANLHDVIFFYTKSKINTFYNQVIPGTFDESRFKLDDKDGKGFYYFADLNKCSQGTIDRLTIVNEIKQRSSGKYYYKRYLSRVKYKGNLIGNIWDDLNRVSSPIYPTEKPLALLERIIKASSNEGDIVLDPFMGSGTTLVAANNLNRKFIGFDISASAMITARSRLGDAKYEIFRMLWNYDDIRTIDPFIFEKMIVEKLGGIPNDVQRGDMGIDGRIIDAHKALIQVKRSDGIGRNVIDNFASAIRREKMDKGIIVAFSFGKGAEMEVARLRMEDTIDIELKQVKDLIKINMAPKLELTKGRKDYYCYSDR